MEKIIFENFKNKKILVTGGTGLIGRQLIKVFNENDIKVISVSLDDYKLDDFNEYLYGDLTNLDYCRKITKGCDYIFHLAGIKGSADVTIKKMSSHFVPTIMMNTNVLDSARFNSVNNLVYTSSIGAYENNEIFKEYEYNIASQPMDFAGWAKRLAELQIYSYKKQYGLKGYKIVRPSNVYGPGDNFDPKNAMVIPSILNRILNKENPLIVWGEGSAIRDFVFSRDVAIGIIQCVNSNYDDDFLNLGSGKETTIKELIETISNLTKFEYKFDTSKSSGYPKRLMDISLAKNKISYNPSTSLKDGLKETWEWLIKNKEEYKLKKNYFK